MRLQPYVKIFLCLWAIIWGFLLHYLLPHFRKQHPWLCFAHPIFRAKEYNQFEVKGMFGKTDLLLSKSYEMKVRRESCGLRNCTLGFGSSKRTLSIH